MSGNTKSSAGSPQRRPSAARGAANPSVRDFLNQVSRISSPSSEGPHGRLIFGLDATMSREPTWDTACQIQAEMFSETSAIGGLDIQLAYFRGFNEFYAGNWTSEPAELLKQMTGIRCRGGYTQIERLLRHTVGETKASRVNALVFIGDSMEENIDAVCAAGGELGLMGVPAFLFHEGENSQAERTFRELARLTHGVYYNFDSSSAAILRDLLSAAAVYAVGGRKALADYGRRKGGGVLRISRQLK